MKDGKWKLTMKNRSVTNGKDSLLKVEGFLPPAANRFHSPLLEGRMKNSAVSQDPTYNLNMFGKRSFEGEA
jgi:hypothetical protein